MKKNRRVIIIAGDRPLDSDAHIRHKMATAEKRASRHASRFPGLDLYAVQKAVHGNLLRLHVKLGDNYLGILDFLNFVKNNRRLPKLTPDNVAQYYSLANMFTLNGVYLFQHLRSEGYDPLVVQNASLVDWEDILQEKPFAVCISSTFLYLDDIEELAARIKAHDPSIAVIAGGMLVKKVLHAGRRLAPQILKWLASFSGKVDAFVVETQGEQTLVHLLRSLEAGRDLMALPNLALFDAKGRVVFTPHRPENRNVDETAIAWDKIPRKYLQSILSVNSSRGCLYRCRFCTYHRWFPKVHYKSLEVLRKELRLIQKLGFVKHVHFADDNFTADKKRLMAVLEMMIDDGLEYKWSAYARASSITPDVAKLMKESGCEFLDMGIESGSQIILDNMDKRLDLGRARDAIQWLTDEGIYCEGGFVVGYPGETAETFSQTVDLINNTGLPYYHPSLFYYSKNMLVHEERATFELEGLGTAWRHKTMDAREASHLMSEMIRRVENGVTGGLTSNWEAFKLLRSEGYSPEQIFDLFKLIRELGLAIEESKPERVFSPRAEGILKELEGMVT